MEPGSEPERREMEPQAPVAVAGGEPQPEPERREQLPDQVADRRNRGRRRIEMKKMEKQSNLLVTFSKRRGGLFKKASELCTLCNAEVALIVFSPGKRVHSFGHPDVETVLERFLTGGRMPGPGEATAIDIHRNAVIKECNTELTHLLGTLGTERSDKKITRQIKRFSPHRFWWETPIEDQTRDQLDQLAAALRALKVDIEEQTTKLVSMGAEGCPNLANPLAGGQVYPSVYDRAVTFGFGYGLEDNVDGAGGADFP